MLVYKQWTARGERNLKVHWSGWFLFGVVPLVKFQLTQD